MLIAPHAGAISERLDVAGSEVGELPSSIWASVEIDFDSLVFELTHDDVNENPSSIRMIPSIYADELEHELQQLFEPVAQEAYG